MKLNLLEWNINQRGRYTSDCIYSELKKMIDSKKIDIIILPEFSKNFGHYEKIVKPLEDIGYDRRIIAYKLGDSNNNELVFATFDEATSLYPYAKPIFHSDRGFQYTNKVFHKKLVDAGMIQSMSNAPMEGWWGILKSEMYYLKKFTSREELVSAIEDYIHFYNTRRYQKRLNCMTPYEYYFVTAA